MKNKEKRVPYINMVVLGLISTILIRYIPTSSFIYVYMLALTLISVTLILLRNIKSKKSNIYTLISAFLIACYMLVISTAEIEYVLKRYMIFYLVLIYCILRFMQIGPFAEKTYRSIAMMLNVFSIANLYQTFFKIPLLVNYMDLIETGFYYHFGESSYRTMSVFNHPIISGLFFIIVFLINFSVIKSKPLLLSLQGLAVLNIYTSQSRSAWLAFIFVCFLYVLNDRKNMLNSLLKPKVKLSVHAVRFIVVVSGVIFLIMFGKEIVEAVALRFGDSLSFNSTSGSNLQRLHTINLIVKHMFSQNIFNLIFGFGGGTVSLFMLKNPIFIQNFTTPDNHYLTLFYEFGLVGLLFYIGLILYIVYKYYKKKNKDWSLKLSFMCFMTINFEFLFFEAWPIVLVMLAFLIAHLLFVFNKKSEINITNETYLNQTVN